MALLFRANAGYEMMHQKKPRVGLFCNMNHTAFVVARYLRDQNIDAEVFRFATEEAHFHPAYDADDDSYTRYVHELTWGGRRHFGRIEPSEIRDTMDKFDILFGCNWVPAYADKAGLRLDFILPHNYDILFAPFEADSGTPWWGKLSKRARDLRARSRHQRRGIESCRNIVTTQFTSEKISRNLSLQGKITHLPFPCVYLPSYERESPVWTEDRESMDRLLSIRNSCDLMVVQPSRQIWLTDKGLSHPHEGNDLQQGQKGNDILIHGFAEFYKHCGKARPSLVLFEYGADVAASKELIADLGIEQATHWLPISPRRVVRRALLLADIGADQFTLGSDHSATVQEVLAAGKPLLHRVSDQYLDKSGQAWFPYMHSETASDVTNWLDDFLANKEHYQKMGLEGRDAVRRNVVEKSLQLFLTA